MNDGAKTETLNELSKSLVLYAYCKIECEETDKLYIESKERLKNIEDKIKDLNTFEFPQENTPTFTISDFSLKPSRGIQLQILYVQLAKTKKEIKQHTNKIKDLRSKCQKLDQNIYYLFYSLPIDDIKKYYDIDTLTSNKKDVIIEYIITNTINDLKNLYSFNITLSTPEIYIGKSTIIELIINQKNICNEKINEHNSSKAKTEFIQAKIIKVVDELDRVKGRLARLQLTPLSKFYNKKDIEKSKSDFRILSVALNDLRAECYLKKEREEELKKDKIDACYRYIKICENLEELINELGEKSLKALIQKLNIIVPKTENNFFNEKEEMKVALKNWFINENIKIMEEIEDQTQSIEKSLERENVLSKK